MKYDNVTKRLLPLVLAVSLAASLAAPAMAVEDAEDRLPQIIIRSSSGAISTPTDRDLSDSERSSLKERFWAYQIFSGVIDRDDYVANRDINKLSRIQWGSGIKDDENVRQALLFELSNDDTPASALGVTFSLMLEAKQTYLSAMHEYKDLYTRYVEENKWDETSSSLTLRERADLEAAFNRDAADLTIGQVFTAVLGLNGNNAAATASKVIADFTPNTGNPTLARAFYAIVFDRETFSNGAEGGYKYLTQEPSAKSTWQSDSGGYWTIGEMDADTGNPTLPDGYYMIRDDYSEKGNTSKATAAYMAGVFGYGILEVKAEAPSVNKTITGAHDYELGDTIPFTLMGTLPENFYTAYEGYPYRFIDTMDGGMSFGGISRVYVRVPNAGGLLGFTGSKYDHYVVDLDSTSGDYQGDGYRLSAVRTGTGTEITVNFPNLKTLKGKKVIPTSTDQWATPNEPDTIPISGESRIYVEYAAWLDEDADIKDYRGNKNTVELYYANDPIWDPGVSVEPQDDAVPRTWANAWMEAPTGVARNTVHVYDFGIQLLMESKDGQPLPGAALALKKTGSSSYALAADEEPNDLYALLHRVKTPQADRDKGAAEYTYYLAQWVSQKDLERYLYPTDESVTRTWDAPLETGAVIGGFRVPDGDEYYASVLTREDGLVRIVGLGAATSYQLEEVITPDKYDSADDVTIKFSPSYISSGMLNSLTATATGGTDQTQTLLENGSYQGQYYEMVVQLPLVNLPEGNLPGTGGMGTTLFYIGGGALLAAAAAIVILSNKKKEKKPEEHT